MSSVSIVSIVFKILVKDPILEDWNNLYPSVVYLQQVHNTGITTH
jgi:hypothetical protein